MELCKFCYQSLKRYKDARVFISTVKYKNGAINIIPRTIRNLDNILFQRNEITSNNSETANAVTTKHKPAHAYILILHT